MPLHLTKTLIMLKKQYPDMAETAEKFGNATSKAEFLMLCDLCGFGESFPSDLLLYIFLSGKANTDSTNISKTMTIQPGEQIKDYQRRVRAATNDAVGKFNAFLDLVYELLTTTTLLDEALKSSDFTGQYGHWALFSSCCNDQATFYKLCRIIGQVGVKLI